jgi:AAA domain, putative AbiEii toxin, Type IV TA system
MIHPVSNMTTVMVNRIECTKSGSSDDVISWLRQTGMTIGEGGGEVGRRYGINVEMPNVPMFWGPGPPFSNLGYMFASSIGAGDAANWVRATESYDAGESLPNLPLQYLYRSPDLEKRLSNACREAFGFGLVVNRYAGSRLHLLVGDAPHETIVDGIPTEAYLQALRTLPSIEREGAGVKNFVGLLLFLSASPSLLTFLDEPDAFLHPPQAELMGRMLVRYKSTAGQLVVATHNSNLLRGLLTDSAVATTVVRLTRKDGRTSAAQLKPEQVRELWADPLLRYSNLLDGLFHTGVVVCEGDADCRFYQSVMDDMVGAFGRQPELLFTYSGGKDRMASVVRTMRAVSVPVAVIADFDVLREERNLRPLTEALGGSWAAIERDWRVMKAALDSRPSSRPSVPVVRDQIVEYLDGLGTPFLEHRDMLYLRSLARIESGWDQAKRSGLAAVPHGDARDSALRLIDALRRIGIFVVEVGELEGFVPTVGGHGPAWLAEVHERNLHRSATAARDLMGHVESYFRPYRTS